MRCCPIQCCGPFGADDWNLNIYFGCTDSNASRERRSMPCSCCTKDPTEGVINAQCGYDARQKTEVDQQLVIYTKGCAAQFETWLQDNLIIMAGTFIGIALLQIWGMCLAWNLVSDIEAVRASWYSPCNSCFKTLDRCSLPDPPVCPTDIHAARTLITEASCNAT